jgi:GDP-4-dehydro-6-deoxy-D-mannose reductase
VNVLGTLGLFDSLRAVGQAPRVLLAGSSAVYGAGGDGPIEETRPLQPRSAYAASKAAQEMVALHYGSQFGLPVIRARTFNLVGPRQPAALVISEIARQIASAERGGPACLKLGNLTPQRDFTDVRDAVRAYARLAEAGLAGEVYNVCTGRAHSVRECAESLLALASVPMRLASDPSRARPADIECQIGSARRLYQLTGWQPVIPFARSLADVLEDWRQQTAQPEELLAC